MCNWLFAYPDRFESGARRALINYHGSKTRLAKEWQRFELLVAREFWKGITKGINKHWGTGVNLHVMGIGIKEFYPCIAFFYEEVFVNNRVYLF